MPLSGSPHQRLKAFGNLDLVPGTGVAFSGVGMHRALCPKRALRSGANDFIVKPFQPEVVKEKVRRHLFPDPKKQEE